MGSVDQAVLSLNTERIDLKGVTIGEQEIYKIANTNFFFAAVHEIKALHSFDSQCHHLSAYVCHV